MILEYVFITLIMRSQSFIFVESKRVKVKIPFQWYRWKAFYKGTFRNVSKQLDWHLKDRQTVCVIVYNILELQKTTLYFICKICNSWTATDRMPKVQQNWIHTTEQLVGFLEPPPPRKKIFLWLTTFFNS